MNKRTIIIISGAVVGYLMLMGLGVVLFSVGQNLQTSTTVTKTVEAPEKPPEKIEKPKGDTQVTLKSDKYDDYIDGAKSIYMEACDDGTNTSYCECTYKWLDSNLTNKEFLDITLEAQKGDVPDKMYDAVKACT